MHVIGKIEFRRLHWIFENLPRKESHVVDNGFKRLVESWRIDFAQSDGKIVESLNTLKRW